MGIKLGKPALGAVSRIKISGTAGGLKVSAASAGGGMDLTRGLLAYWKGNGDDTDSSGNGINLTNNGSGYAAGLFGQAFDFGGTAGTQLSRGVDDTSLNIMEGDFTISLWYRPKNFNSSTGYTLAHKADGTDVEMILHLTKPKGLTPAKLNLRGYGGSPLAFSLPTVTLETWHHFLLRQESGTAEAFYDGNSLGAGSGGNTTNPSTTYFTLGGTDTGESILDGLLDDTAIWGRALTNGEITYIWNGGAGNPVG